MKIIKFENIKKKNLLFKLKTEHKKTEIIPLPDYLKTDSDKYNGVLVNNVPLSFLPHGEGFEVRGMYEIGRHSMSVARDLPPGMREHTKRHERVHSYGFRDEIVTDRIASRQDYGVYAA